MYFNTYLSRFYDRTSDYFNELDGKQEKRKTSAMKSKYLWLIIIIETLVLIAGGIFIARHLKCYHDQGKPRIYYYGPRGGKYYIDDIGKKVYVKDRNKKDVVK